MKEPVKPAPEADQGQSVCPICKEPVAFKWVRGGGFVSEPHNVLIADCVFHAECWDDAMEFVGAPDP